MSALKLWFVILLAVTAFVIITSPAFYDFTKELLNFLITVIGWPLELQG
jgi:hypothetical protein